MLNGIIFTGGDYPSGSSARRIRLWHDGLFINDIFTKVIIIFPRPSKQDQSLSEDFVDFMLTPTGQSKGIKEKQSRNLKSIFEKIYGALKGYFTVLMTNNLSFIFLYGIDFLSGVLVLTLCRAKGLVFFVERTDENRRSFKNDKKIWDRIGILNEVMFDYFIVHRADCLFVVSEYLENKYKAKFPELNVKRSVPSFINIDQFKHESNNNINDLGDIDVTSFQLSVPVIMFAGSCIYTNGLEFFLMNAEQVYKSGFDFRIVLLFFKGDVDYIRFQICKYKLDEICMIYENINPQYIPAFYQKADILVIPEMGDVVANAGFPGKTAECLAAGKAIISTNFSNLKDILINDENCLISDLGDSETYQINLKRLIQDTNLRERLGAHAIQTAIEFFDYKKSVTPMVNELKLHQAI